MAANLYDALLDGEEQRVKQADAATQYDALLDAEEGAKRTQVRASLRNALPVNPDDAAKAGKIASRTGIPDDVILRNLKDAQLQEAVDVADMRLLTSPVLEDRVRDIGFARKSHDDLPLLADLEARVAKYGELKNSRGPDPTFSNIALGLLKAFPQGVDLVADGLTLQVEDALGIDSSRTQKAYNRTAARVQASTPEFESATAAGLYSGGTSLVRQVPGIAASILLRSPAPALAAAGVQTEAEAYGKYTARGASGGQAFTAAVGEGAVEVLTEKIPMGFIVDRFGKTGAKEFLAGLIGRELPTEQVATFLQDAIDTAVANPDKTWGDYFKERPAAAYQTLLATLVQSGAMGGASAAAGRLQRQQKRQAQDAQHDGEALADLLKFAEQSKLRERDPGAFADFVQRAAEHSNAPPEVFIDAATLVETLAQSGLTPEQVNTALPSVAPQLDEALHTGGDVSVPVGEFAALIGGSGLEANLLKHVRTSPDALSQDEAAKLGEGAGKALKATAEKVAAETQQADATTASVQKVRDTVFEQLQTAARFTKDVNGAYADLVGSFYATQAGRLGITPEELFAKHPLTVQAAGTFGETLAQRGTTATVATGESVAGQESAARQPGDQNTDASLRAVATGKRSPLTGKPIFDIQDAAGKSLEQMHIASTAEEALQILRERPARRAAFAANPPPIYVPPKNPPEPRSGWKVYRGEVGSHLDPDEFYYHVTTHAAARDIIRNGLIPGAGQMFTAGLYPAHARGRVFLTEVDGVNFWREKVEQQLQHAYDKPPAVAVVRIPKSAVQGAQVDEIGSEDARATAYFVEGTVAAKNEPAASGGSDALDQADRGIFSPSTGTITLLAQADLSTFLHETGHFYLEVLADLAAQPDAPADIVKDMQTALEWFGVPDLAAWKAMTLDQQRESHEKFARGFEAYLFEGKAPSMTLAGVFQRFRSWLVNVYRQITSLNVEINPEIRGVFDRLLASEVAIKEAEAARAYAPLFQSAKEAGMTPEQWTEYQQLGAEATDTATATLQARSARDMRWLSNARSKVLRDLQREAAEKRKAIRSEVEAEVQAQPVYAARRFIQRGLLPGETEASGPPRKLSIADVKALYAGVENAPDISKLGYGKYGMLREDGLHPDTVAEMTGFDSGDAMVRALLDAQPYREVVDGMTDQRMLERYGDIADPQALERAADAAIHNEARGRFVATELAALDKAVGKPRVLAAAAKQFAAEIVASKKVRDIKPAQYAAAEVRAAKEAERSSDLVERVTAKRNQLLNHYTTRAAQEALTEVERGVEYLRKFEKDGVRKALDVDYVDQIDSLLERFDLRRGQSLKAIDKRKSLAAWVKSQEDMGLSPTIDDALLNEANRQHFRDMTLEEFRGLVDAVRNIEHLGRLKQKLLTAKDQREFKAYVEQAAASITANARKVIPTKIERNTLRDRAGEGLNEFLAMHRKFASIMREMDGSKDAGVLWDLFVRPMNERGNQEAVARAAATEKLSALFEPILKSGNMHRRMQVPGTDISLSREGRLAVALNWGNEANRQRVLDGDRWSPAQAQAILNSLTAQEWDFVQGVWDYVDSFWPDIAAKERRVSGVVPEKVAPAEFNVTVDGQSRTVRGGYYPIKYDPTRSSKAESDTAAEVLKQMLGGAYTRATTRRGHTKGRVETVNRAVRKDLGVLFEHVTQVTHDLAWHEWLIDAQRLLRAGPIDGAIRDHYGPETLKALKQAVDDIAIGELPAQNAFERSVNHLRVGATIAGLGWNLMTSLMQPLGLTQSMVRIGPKWVAKGLATWIGDAAHMENSAKAIYEKSDFMRLRAQTQQREVSEIRNKISGSKLTAIEASYFWMIQASQKIADIPTWLGAYEKAIAGGHDEATAIALADQGVLDAQGGGQIKDLAGIQRGGPLMKLWTNFYSFFNTTYNLSAESVNRTNFRDPLSVGRLAVDFLLLYTVPALLATLVKHAIVGGDDDEEKFAKKVVADQLNYLLGSMVGLREVGAGVQAALGQFSSYNGPAGVRFFAELAKLGKQVQQGELDEALLKSLNSTAGILFHYPSGQVQRTVQGFEALREGKTRNPLVLLAGPPKS